MAHYARFMLNDTPYPMLGRLIDADHAEIMQTGYLSQPLPTGNVVSLSSVAQWLAPCTPTKIVAVGLNYKDHAKEFNSPIPEEPLLFGKAVSSLNWHGGTIVRPSECTRLDYEAELAVVIGHRASRVCEADALNYVAGYTCANDVTARDLQKKDGQFHRAKSFDTFCPVGPFLVTDADPSDLAVESRLNGKVMQHSRTSQLIFPVPRLVSYISHIMTLLPGDLILTGTPGGIAPMKAGDVIEVEIEGLGILKNTITDRA
ncbi:MAG: fumarylacetoacetate hydrolase family protein [Pyramidobacter sp.]|nr:fumarylacetoacetate hydrolase family protein [Pyramidobacter sp.]